MDLTSRALARMIEGKTPEEIRATFKLPDDLTEEEKLEPLKSGLADARIKLLNKLYAKKRQVRRGDSCSGACFCLCCWQRADVKSAERKPKPNDGVLDALLGLCLESCPVSTSHETGMAARRKLWMVAEPGGQEGGDWQAASAIGERAGG